VARAAPLVFVREGDLISLAEALSRVGGLTAHDQEALRGHLLWRSWLGHPRGMRRAGRTAVSCKIRPWCGLLHQGLIVVGPSGIIPVDQLEECAVFAAALLHLIEQREFVAVKSAEPLIPAKVLKLVFTGAAWEIEAQHTPRILPLSAAYDGRRAVMLLHPLADLVVISCCSSLRSHNCQVPQWAPSQR